MRAARWRSLRRRESLIDATRARESTRDDALDRALAIAALALVLVGLGFFWAAGLRDRISSDAGVTLLLARHILDTGALLPADWYYGNGDLWILGPHLLSLPFVALWGITPLALACGNALGLACIFASAFALGRAVGARWPVALLAASLTISLYSHFQREFVAVQLSYGWMSAKLMLLLCLAIVWLRSPDAVRPRPRVMAALIAYALLLGVWTAENPVRPLVYFVLPFGIVLALRSVRMHRATLVLVAATLTAFGTGCAVRYWLLQHLLMMPGLESFHFARVSEWPGHLKLLSAGLRHLYGGDALGLPQFPLIEQMLAWMRAASIPVIAIALALVRKRARRDSENVFARFPLEVGILDFAIIACALVIGSTMVDPVGDRYLIPAWHLALVSAVVAARQIAHWRWIALLFVIAFALGGVFNAVGIQRSGSAIDAAGLPRPPELDAVIDALRRTGLVRGFATHRYANAATVRSRGELQLCDVLFAKGISPARWINQTSCFDPARYAGGFFVLLAADEKDPARVAALQSTIGQPRDVIDVDGYSVWTYPAGSGDLAWLSR